MSANPKHNAAVADVLIHLDAQLKAAKAHLAHVKRLEATDSYAAAKESVEIWATLYDAVDDGQLEWRRPEPTLPAEQLYDIDGYVGLTEAEANGTACISCARPFREGEASEPMAEGPTGVLFAHVDPDDCVKGDDEQADGGDL